MTPRDKKPKLGICPEARKWPGIQTVHIGYPEKPRNRIDRGWPMGQIWGWGAFLSIKVYWNIASLLIYMSSMAAFLGQWQSGLLHQKSTWPTNIYNLFVPLRKTFADPRIADTVLSPSFSRKGK